ncbi:cation:proton antiporter [Candidatus Woesearchaeota archaeon]|nr:cation:proton antiporter [Candidatus Woesearchaeota archaeon]
MDSLLILTNIAVVLLLGLLCSFLAKKLKISDVLVLLLLGILIGRLAYNGQPLFVFDNIFITAVGVLALVMVVFDSASRFRLDEKNSFSRPAFKMIGWFFLFTILIIPSFTNILFFKSISLNNVLLSLILTLIIVGTDLDAVIVMLSDYGSARAKKVLGLLHTEATLNTFLVVVLPFIVLDIINNLSIGQTGAAISFWSQLWMLVLQLIVGIGAGVVIGLVILRTMQRFYHHHVSPIILVAAALLAYVVAEHLGGNGAFAVASLGFLFGSFYVKEKPKLQEFSSMLSNMLEILIFIILGILIRLPLTFDFITKSLLIFILIVICRLAAVFVSTRKSDYSLKEKFFISLSLPKGIAVVVVVFFFALYNEQSFATILNLVLAVTIYSLLLSLVLDKLSRIFLGNNAGNSHGKNIIRNREIKRKKKRLADLS